MLRLPHLLPCRYKNASGVEIRPYDFGGLGGVYDIDPGVSLTGIYSTLIDHLKSAGYSERQDLFGAPYDFRLAADGLSQVRHSRACAVACLFCSPCCDRPA